MTRQPAATTIHGVTVDQVADRWLAQYGSAATRNAYGTDLRKFLDWCAAAGHAPLQVGPNAIARHRSDRLAAGASEATVNRQQSALRAFFTAAAALGIPTGQPFGAEPPRPDEGSSTFELSPEALGRLLAASRPDARAEVLVRLLAGEGLGLTEALSLDHEHVTGAGPTRRLRVTRDGVRHAIPLLAETSSAIARLQRGTTRTGPLLVARRGTNTAGRLTRFGADRILKQVATVAGIDHPVSANVLRRAHVTMAQRAGHDPRAIRDRMGHRDLRTTRRYFTSGAPTLPSTTSDPRHLTKHS